MEINKNLNSNNIILAYEPNKFFWVSVSDDYKATSNNFCDIQKCDDTNLTEENIHDCYMKEICDNKKNSEILQTLHSHHSSADGRYFDTSNTYKKTMLETLNLGVGVLAMISLNSMIYYSQ
jgi:hypothetical protein